jgi:hypothetical protein
VWGVFVLVGFALIAGLLGSALSSEGDVTNNPESKQAEELIDGARARTAGEHTLAMDDVARGRL